MLSRVLLVIKLGQFSPGKLTLSKHFDVKNERHAAILSVKTRPTTCHILTHNVPKPRPKM